MFQCDEDAYQHLQKIVDDKAATLPTERTPEPSKPDCPICLTSVDLSACYVTECCGHIYCMDCAKNLVQNSQTNNVIPILCAQKDCNQPLVLQDLRNLGVHVEGIREVGLRVFMTANQKLYGYCPTANCSMIYRKGVQDDGGVGAVAGKDLQAALEKKFKFTCSLCNGSFCTKCEVSLWTFKVDWNYFKKFKNDLHPITRDYVIVLFLPLWIIVMFKWYNWIVLNYL